MTWADIYILKKIKNKNIKQYFITFLIFYNRGLIIIIQGQKCNLKYL